MQSGFGTSRRSLGVGLGLCSEAGVREFKEKIKCIPNHACGSDHLLIQPTVMVEYHSHYISKDDLDGTHPSSWAELALQIPVDVTDFYSVRTLARTATIPVDEFEHLCYQYLFGQVFELNKNLRRRQESAGPVLPSSTDFLNSKIPECQSTWKLFHSERDSGFMAGFSDSPLEGTGYEEVVRTTGLVRDAFNLLFKLPHCRKSQARYQLQLVRTGVSTEKTQNI
ncbi:hypothetical protein J6590_092146, partial [Homalodisca vitripennis]